MSTQAGPPLPPQLRFSDHYPCDMDQQGGPRLSERQTHRHVRQQDPAEPSPTRANRDMLPPGASMVSHQSHRNCYGFGGGEPYAQPYWMPCYPCFFYPAYYPPASSSLDYCDPYEDGEEESEEDIPFHTRCTRLLSKQNAQKMEPDARHRQSGDFTIDYESDTLESSADNGKGNERSSHRSKLDPEGAEYGFTPWTSIDSKLANTRGERTSNKAVTSSFHSQEAFSLSADRRDTLSKSDVDYPLSTYRRKNYQPLSQLAQYFAHLEPDDQDDVIGLLLHCRNLEREVEEQDLIIDVLEKDLVKAKETLRFPSDQAKK